MTDEQANNITREQAIRILHPDTCVDAIDDYEEAGNYEHAYDTAILMAIAALRDVQARQKGCERCLHFPLDDGSYDDNLYCFSCGRQIFKKRPTPEQSSEVEKGGGE